MSTNPTNKFTQPDFTSQDAATYKANLDGAANVMQQIGAAFAPSAQDTPDMTVLLHAGNLFVAGALVEVAEQSTGTITAPSSNNRIDLVYIDMTTGAVGVATGVEDAVPSAPVVPSGKLPVATVSLATSTTAIQDTAITDVRIALYAPDLGTAAYGDIGTDVLAPDGDASDLTNVPGDVITTRGDVIVGNASGAPTRLAIGTSGKVLKSDGTDVSWDDEVIPEIAGGIPTNSQSFTSSGTFTVPAGVTLVEFRVQGRGGAGGGTAINHNAQGAGGGSAGRYCRALVPVTPGENITITIPTTAAATTVGSYISCPCGGDAIASVGSAGAPAAIETVATGVHVLDSCAERGHTGHLVYEDYLMSGSGGNSPWGVGGLGHCGKTATGTSRAGNSATGYGAGGGGALSLDGNTTYAAGTPGPAKVVAYWSV